MSSIQRRISRGISKSALKSGGIQNHKGNYSSKLKKLTRIGTITDTKEESDSINTLVLAKLLLNLAGPLYDKIIKEEVDADENSDIKRILLLLLSDKDRINNIFAVAARSYRESVHMVADRTNSYLREVDPEYLNVSVSFLIRSIAIRNKIFDKEILSNKDKYLKLSENIVEQSNIGIVNYAENLRKKIATIGNDYTKGFAFKKILMNLNSLVLDLIIFLKLEEEEDMIINTASELLTRCTEMSNTYSLMDSSYEGNKVDLAMIIKLSYMYTIYKAYEEKHNYLKSRMMKDISAFFIDKSDENTAESLLLLGSIVNYDINNNDFFVSYAIDKPEIVKPLSRIFFVALADILSIDRVVKTYSNIILDELKITKNEYIKRLLVKMSKYDEFLSSFGQDKSSILTRLYYLTYHVEKVAISNAIKKIDAIQLDKILRKNKTYKEFKNNIIF